MSKPSSARFWNGALAWRIAAIVMIIAGVAARGLGASFAVFFVFLGLMVVCLVISLVSTAGMARKAARDNYGVRIRTGDSARDQMLNADLSKRAAEMDAHRHPGKEWALLALTIVLFWPAIIAIVIAVTGSSASPVKWTAAAAFTLLFILSGTDWIRTVRANRVRV